MTNKKMPRQDARQKQTQTHFTAAHHHWTRADVFEREVGKFAGRIADLPGHFSQRRPA